MSSAVQNRQPWLAHGYPEMRSPTPSGAPRQTWTDESDKSLDDSFPLRYRLQTQASADIYHLEHINALLQHMDAEDEEFLTQLVEQQNKNSNTRFFKARPKPKINKQISSLIGDYIKKYKPEEAKERESPSTAMSKTPLSSNGRSSARTKSTIGSEKVREPVYTDASGQTYYRSTTRPSKKMVVPHPGHRYPDRHARCFDLDHVHTPLITSHPSAGCNCFSPCAEAEYTTVGTLIASTPPYKMGRPRSAHMCGLHRCPTGQWPSEEVRQSDRNIAYGLCPRPTSPHTNNDTDSRLSGKSNCYYHGSSKVPEFTSIVHRVEVHKRNNQEYPAESDDKDNLQGDGHLDKQIDGKSAWNIDEEERDTVGDGMLIIDPTSAEFIDDDDADFFRAGGRDLSNRKKKIGKGGKSGKKDGGEKGGKKKKAEEGEGKGGKKKKGEKDVEDGKGKKGKKGECGKEDKRDKKGKKSDGGADKEGKGGKGRRTPQDDSAVAADERRMREEEERKRREAEDRDEEKERQKRAREMKMAMEAELAAEREREAAEKKSSEDEVKADGRINRNRLYANEDEALEAEMNSLRRKAKMANRGNASGGGGRGDLSRSSSDVEGTLTDSRAELAERRRREMDEKLTWMTSHLGLSRQSCRFELPMDMRLLETMTPREYLSKYCVISSKRMLLYKRVFGRFVSKAQQPELRYDDVAEALREVHIHGISEEQMKTILRLVNLEGCLLDGTTLIEEKGTRIYEADAVTKNVDFNFFAGIAALTERILYPIFFNSIPPSRQLENVEEPLDDTQPTSTFATKEKLEKADFFCMPWKFDGIDVNPLVKKLLEVL